MGPVLSKRERTWIAVRLRPSLWLVLASLFFGLWGSASAERIQHGNLIVALNGGITPLKLPREHTVPVKVHLSGKALTSDASPLPRVNWIRLELAWRGVLNARGLPVCPQARLISTDTRQAIERCGPARVGTGTLLAKIFVPNQEDFNVPARIVAFNGRTKSGRHAVLVHAYAATPPVSFVIPFSIHHRSGAFRTVLIALIRRSAGPWPHVSDFSIAVARRFRYRGKEHSYLKASCPLPNGLTAAFLSLARATYSFQGGRHLTIGTVRSCRAR